MWPGRKFDPLTPAGEAEQVDRILSGLARQSGWRRRAAKIAAAAALLLIAALIALQVAHLV
jgi:hypothetical protein